MAEPTPESRKKFLVVVDGTEECDRALTFAAFRVRRMGGALVLLSVLETSEFQQWLGVEDIMRAEARHEAETNLDARIARINKLVGPITIETVIREGRPVEEIDALLRDDRDIAILVLAASVSLEGPGPLVTAFATRSGSALRIPVTIVPGHMSDEDISAVF